MQSKARYDKSGWRASRGMMGGPSKAQLAHYIWKRMKYNRDGRYVFTREWVRQQYPGTPPKMLDDALQHLVDTGKISALPK